MPQHGIYGAGSVDRPDFNFGVCSGEDPEDFVGETLAPVLYIPPAEHIVQVLRESVVLEYRRVLRLLGHCGAKLRHEFRLDLDFDQHVVFFSRNTTFLDIFFGQQESALRQIKRPGPSPGLFVDYQPFIFESQNLFFTQHGVCTINLIEVIDLVIGSEDTGLPGLVFMCQGDHFHGDAIGHANLVAVTVFLGVEEPVAGRIKNFPCLGGNTRKQDSENKEDQSIHKSPLGIML